MGGDLTMLLLPSGISVFVWHCSQGVNSTTELFGLKCLWTIISAFSAFTRHLLALSGYWELSPSPGLRLLMGVGRHYRGGSGFSLLEASYSRHGI